MADPFDSALADVRSNGRPPGADPFETALSTVRGTPPDTRSRFARAFDVLSEPSAPGRWVQQKARSFSDWLTTPRLDDSRAWAMAKGFLGGATEGAGDVAAGYSSPVGIAAGLSGLGAEKAGAAGLVNAARALRGIEAATGAGLAARGLEQAAEAPDLAGKALGVSQAAAGALGVRAGVNGVSKSLGVLQTAPRAAVGALPPAASFIADASGRVAPMGTPIPMEPAPDGSFVRSVPAEYARREPAGLLPAARGFVGDERGTVAPVGQEIPTSTASPANVSTSDASSVRSVPAAIADRDFERAKVLRTIYSGDPNAVDAPKVQLSDAEANELRRMAAELEAVPFTKRTFLEQNRHGGTPEVIGGSAGAPVFQDIIRPLGYQPTRAQVANSIQDFLAGQHNALGQEALAVARLRLAGDRSVAPPILPPEAGHLPTPLADESELSVPAFATALAQEGEKPIADVPFSLTPEAAQRKSVQPSLLGSGASDFDRFAAALDDVRGNGASSGIREPGEEGRIDPLLASRLGLGGAGAAYGAATGTDTRDRLERAALFGLAGAALPSIVSSGRGLGVLRTGIGAPNTAPATEPGRQFAPKPDAMPNGPIPAAQPMPPEQKFDVSWLGRYTPELRAPIARTFQEYDAFEPQRRFRMPDARVEALAQNIAVDMAQARPGSIGNVEESRAMANATATLFDRAKALRGQLAQSPNDPATQAQLAKLYADGGVLLGNVRANATEQGRALRGQQIINQVLQSYDERILAEASKRLGPQLKLFADQLARIPGDDPVAFYRLLREHVQQQQGPLSKVFPFLYANVLSGPATWLKAALGTGSNLLFQGATNLVAGALESRKPLAERSVLLSEPTAAWAAMTDGLMRGGKAAGFVLRHGFDPLAIERGEIPYIGPELPGGAATNFGPRMLKAIHGAFLGEAARSFEATSIGYTQAAKEAAAKNLTGDALTQYLAERTPVIASSPDVQAQAANWAQRVTFMEDPGRVGNAFGQLVNSSRALKFLALFWRVPFNIARQQITQNTALAFVPPFSETSGVYAGGRVGAQAQARALLGTAMLAPLAAAVGSGLATGAGPEDPAHRPLWLSTHRANSLRIGDHWQDYRSLPVAEPLSILANAFEAYHEGRASDHDVTQVLGALAARMGNVVTSQPFLSGLTDFINAMERPQEAGSTMLKTAAQTVVPYAGALRNTTRAVDPVIREVHSPLDAAKEIIPGLSSTLPPRLDLFGQPLTRPGGPVTRALSPTLPVPASSDPVATYLDTIQQPLRTDRRETSLNIAPGVRIPVPADVDLSRRESGGQTLHAVLEQVIANPRFQALPAPQQQAIVSQLTNEVRGQARTVAGVAAERQALQDPAVIRRALLQRLQEVR